MTPMSGRGWNTRAQVPGGPVLTGSEQVTWLNAVAPGWFETLGMRVLLVATSPAGASGRNWFRRQRNVRASIRRPGKPDRSAGQISGPGPAQQRVIVGVVNDAVYRTAQCGLRSDDLRADDAGRSVPFGLLDCREDGSRASRSGARHRGLPSTVSIRSWRCRSATTATRFKRPCGRSASWRCCRDSSAGWRCLLSALGLYGVTSYSVNRRRPELAVRIALGASTAVVMLVLGRVSFLLLSGLVIGGALHSGPGSSSARCCSALDPRDPVTLGGAAALLLAVGMVAGWLPAP